MTPLGALFLVTSTVITLLRLGTRLPGAAVSDRGAGGHARGVLIVAGVLVVACGSSQSVTSGPPHTTVGSARAAAHAGTATATASAPVTRSMTYEPWTSSGTLEPGLTVKAAVAADCQELSIADSGRSAALRCFAGNEILDPCFIAGSQQQAACLTSPWETGVTIVHFTALPSPQPAPSPLPWAIELSDGERCLFAAGATLAVGDERLNFSCARAGAPGLSLWGTPDHTHEPWTISSSSTLPNDPAFRLANASIDVVWF